MTTKQHVTCQNSYRHIAQAEVKGKVQHIIDNFAARRIRNFETAKYVLDKVTSSNKKTVVSGLTAYDKVMAKYEHAAPVGKP